MPWRDLRVGDQRGAEPIEVLPDRPRLDEQALGPRVVSVEQVPDDCMILDIGPRTWETYVRAVALCQTILWNGPMGVFEFAPFAEGTKAVAHALADRARSGVTVIVGGGSTAEAVGSLGLADAMTHVSTGGGAALELLEGKTLPGVAALMDKDR